MRGRLPAVVLLALSLALVLAAIPLSEAARSGRSGEEELLYFPSGRFLREAALGYDHMVASILWIRAVQYYGHHKRTDNRFDMMFHLSDVITDLDPHFEEPYLFGALVILTENDSYQEALDLLEKGRRYNPESWRIFFESGFVRYIFWKDYEGALPYFRRAAAIEGAPERTRRFAAFVAQRAGHLETSYLLWQEVARTSSNPELRKKAMEHIRELENQIRLRRAEGL